MRVLVVTNLYPNPTQPNRATFNRQQFRALAARHSVAVIAPIAWTEALSARWRGRARLPVDRRVECDGIVAVHPLYWFPPKILRGSYGRLYSKSIARAFHQMVEEFHPDVVLGSWAYPDGWAAVTLGHRAGLPVVVKVHGSDVLLMKQFPKRRSRTIDALREADGVIAVSRDLAREVERLGVEPAKISVVYNGIDTALFCPGSRDDARRRLDLEFGTPLILFVGNLVPVKGLDVFIDACSQLHMEGVAFKGYLVGEGKLRAVLERRIASLGLQGRVIMMGARPHAELPDWFRAADVVALASHSEGVPNVLMEASACATPFVATEVGGIPEIAQMAGGRLVAPNDPPALAAALAVTLKAGSNGLSHPASPAQMFKSHADSAVELAIGLEAAMSRFRCAERSWPDCKGLSHAAR